MQYRDVLAAFAVARRSIVLSIWTGSELTHIRRLTIHSQLERASDSLRELFLRAVQHFEFATMAIETTAVPDTRIANLANQLRALARENAISVFEIGKRDLETLFWVTPYRSRQQLRDAVLAIWPALSDRKLGRLACDSVAVGVFAQAQRLIGSHIPEMNSE